MIKENLEKIQKKILAINKNTKLLVVSKTYDSNCVKEAYEAGQVDFAENYIQEALEKIKELSSLKIRWHFIGRIQTNKLKNIVGQFVLIHSIDRLEILDKIQKICESKNIFQDILIQIDFWNQETKAGFNKEEASKIFKNSMTWKNIKIKGFMVFPPLFPNVEQRRKEYLKVKDYLNEPELKNMILSMGTSDDYEQAIEIGSHIVRIGSLIFGKRK